MSKKVMLIIVLLALMFLGMTAEAKAMEVEDGSVAMYTDVREKIAELGLPEFTRYDSDKEYLLYKAFLWNSYYCLIECPKDSVFYVSRNNNTTSVAYSIYNNNNDVCHAYVSTDNGWSDEFADVGFSAEIGYLDYCPDAIQKSSSIFYSDFDIYTDNSCTSIFFQATPHPIPLVLGMEAGILAAMIQPEIVLQEVTTLLPIVIPVMAGWTGLSKALQLLSKLLNQA